MQMHTAITVDELLKQHLPHGYSVIIAATLKKKGRKVSTAFVRSVKALIYQDLQILNLLIELAKTHKAYAEAEQKKLERLTSK